jgi:hypothetical protein
LLGVGVDRQELLIGAEGKPFNFSNGVLRLPLAEEAKVFVVRSISSWIMRVKSEKMEAVVGIRDEKLGT